MLPLAARGFIYIAGSDLVPELNKEVQPAKSVVQMLAIAIGVGLMLLQKCWNKMKHDLDGINS